MKRDRRTDLEFDFSFNSTIKASKEEKRDPRFDPLCGEFDKASFR